MSSPETQRRSPYQGLIPYSEADAPFFFGREKETRLIIANLFASPLTLLYGPSGVGKSSVLRAGVANRLHEREDLLVVVFNSWQSNPVSDLTQAVADFADLADHTAWRKAVRLFPQDRPQSLTEFLSICAEQLNRRLMIILDQFEEYFLYHPQDDEFAAELSKAVTQSNAPISFLISIREDFYAKLDRFEGRIPSLYDNYLRIDHLDRNSARVAIEQPIEQYNRVYESNGSFSVERELVESVLRQVETGRVIIGEAGRGVIEAAKSPDEAAAQIETPFLQLVMTRLWETELAERSQKLRLETLNRLGGAKTIVRSHLDEVMSALLPREQEFAARIFHYLVTPSGTKIAYTASDLAGSAKLNEPEVLRVLEKLSHGDVRILRTVDPGLEGPVASRYEIFHDVLAPAILAWRAKYVQAQERADAEQRAEEQQQRADQQAAIARRLRRLVAALVVVIMLALGTVVYAFAQRSQARAYAREAEKNEKAAVAYAQKSEELKKEGERLSERGKMLQALGEQAQHEAAMALKQVDTERGRTEEQIKIANNKKAEAEKARAEAATEKKVADISKLEATAERERAETQARATRVAFSNLLAVQSGVSLNESPQLSLLLGVESLNATRPGDPKVTAAEEALRGALAASGGRTLTHQEESVNEVKISADNHWVVSLSGSQARIVDLTGSVKPRDLPNVSSPIVISSDSRWLITGGSKSDKEQKKELIEDKIIVWDLAAAEQVAQLDMSDEDNSFNPDRTVLISPDARWLIVGRHRPSVRLWNLKNIKAAPKSLLLDRGKDLSALDVSPDGHWLFASSGDSPYGGPKGIARLWDLSSDDPSATRMDLEIGKTMITRATFSADSQWLAAGSGKVNPRTAERDHLVRVWSLKSPHPSAKPWRTFDNKAPVTRLALSPDNSRLFTVGENVINQWDLTAQDEATNKGEAVEFATTTPALSFSEIAVSSDSEKLAAVMVGAGFMQVSLWKRPHWASVTELIGTFNLPFNREKSTAKVDFSPDNHFLLAYDTDNTATVWDLVSNRKVTLRGHDGLVTFATISKDGKQVATASEDKTIRLWDFSENTPSSASPIVLDKGDDFFLSPDQRWLVTRPTNETFHVWDLKLQAPLAKPFATVPAAYLDDVAFTSDSHWMVSGHHDDIARLWDLTAPKPFARPKAELKGHSRLVDVVTISSDNRLLATGSFDGTVRLWDLTTLEPALIKVLPENAPAKRLGENRAINGVQISSDKRWLVTSGSPDSLERLWDLKDQNPTASSKLLGPNNGFAISPNSHWLVILDKKNSARLWNLTAQDPSANPIVLNDVKFPFEISSDSNWLITGSEKDIPKLWNLNDPSVAPVALTGRVGSLQVVAFSPDSRWLVVGGDDKTIRMWKLTTAGPATEPLSLSGDLERRSNLHFSPNSQLLLTSGSNLVSRWGTTRLWDLTNENPADTSIILPRPGDVGQAAFVRLGSSEWLITGNRNEDGGDVVLWPIRLDDLKSLACRVAGRNLTPDEWKKYLSGEKPRDTCTNLPAQR